MFKVRSLKRKPPTQQWNAGLLENDSLEDLLENVGAESREPEASAASDNAESSREELNRNAVILTANVRA